MFLQLGKRNAQNIRIYYINSVKLSSNNQAAIKYCVDLVRTHDFDNYLAGLLFPVKYRTAFYALRAFNIEIALLKEQAMGNIMSARVRMQWWKDILNNIYSGKVSRAQSPVAYLLGESIMEHQLSRIWIDRLLDARMNDLVKTQHETVSDLEDYAERTYSSLLYLLLEVISPIYEML